MSGVIGAFFERAGVGAQTSWRWFCGLDLGHLALSAISSGSDQRVANALASLDQVDMSRLRLGEDRRNGSVMAAFDVGSARAHCEALLARTGYLGRAATGVLLWILAGDTEDHVGGFKLVRGVLAENGLSSELLLDVERRRRESVAVGRLVDPNGEIIDADDLSGHTLVGRRAQLATHLMALRRALVAGEHYLVVGPAGGGKTMFVRRLAEAALRSFRHEENPRLRDLRFCYCNRIDLVRSASEAPAIFDALVEMMEAGITPIIDDVDLVMSVALPSGEAALRALGHEFVAGRRGFLLAAERGAARRTQFINQLTPRTLPPVNEEQAGEIAEHHVSARMLRDPTLVVPEGPEAIGRRAQRLARENYAIRSAPLAVLKLLDGAIDLARELGRDELLSTDLTGYVARDLNTPREMVERDGKALFASLQQQLLGEVVAQDVAVERVAQAVAFGERTSTGNAPLARILMAGPPGVGKTYLARRVAEALGYDAEAFIMLNMSEFSSESARTRFIGPDPGYIGFDQTVTILDRVRARPSCVVLLDEIDRAHPSIQDILLSMLEGQGADAKGQPVYFTNAIIMATTNLGTEQIETRWQAAERGGISRNDAAAGFDDATLRALILHGAIDETERKMQIVLDNRVAETRSAFAEATAPDKQEDLIAVYVDAVRSRSALEMTRRHSLLDRAFLDRIDVVVPFFPINTVADITQILALELRRAGWADCPKETQAAIVKEVLNGGSVRAIKRLVKKELGSVLRSADSPASLP